jgi:Domain of unknown function (DUF932)
VSELKNNNEKQHKQRQTMTTTTESARAIRALTNEEMRERVPSIFAATARADVSDRYLFVPTSSILEGMRQEGWVPVEVNEQRVKRIVLPNSPIINRNYQKHMVRFAKRDEIERFRSQLEPGKHVLNYAKPLATRTDIVLINSHDRTSGCQLYGAPYRLVCFNGLVVSDAIMEHMSIRHVGFNPAQVIQASVEMAREIPRIMETMAGWQDRIMTDAERVELARRALEIRWTNASLAPIGPRMLLEPRRAEDSGNDLWLTWNVVQENLLKGGVKDQDKRWEARSRGERAPGRTRAVRAINENLRINRALWDLAEEFSRN